MTETIQQKNIFLRVLGLLCLVFLLSSLSSLLEAQDVEVDAETGDAVEQNAEVDQARALEISQELRTRQLAIEDLQSEVGIYDVALLEAYSDLAMLLNEIEDYESAIAVYQNALQVARISSGLESEEQIPVLEALIDNNRKLAKWQEVDDLYELTRHVSSRAFKLPDYRYLLAVESYGEWKQQLLRENLLDENYNGLSNRAVELSQFYALEIYRIETQSNIMQEDLLDMIYGKSLADLAMANSVATTPYTAFRGREEQFVNEVRCSIVRNSQGEPQRRCVTVQVENPRYRRSQLDAKQNSLSRYSNSVIDSLEKLEAILQQSTSLTQEERDQLEARITQLRSETEAMLRNGRRRLR